MILIIDSYFFSLSLGYGCTDLISAVAYAFSEMSNSTINVFSKPPYFTGYEEMASLYPGRMQFTTSTNLDPTTVLEYNTYPTNPIGFFFFQPFFFLFFLFL